MCGGAISGQNATLKKKYKLWNWIATFYIQSQKNYDKFTGFQAISIVF